MVRVESQPFTLLKCCTTTPVSAGLQEVRYADDEDVGSSVVVIVRTESQPYALLRCRTTTPVSAGLQEVKNTNEEVGIAVLVITLLMGLPEEEQPVASAILLREKLLLPVDENTTSTQ
jgi:hypothetical protein